MTSLFDMIFGTANTTNNLTSPATQQAVNTAFTQAYTQYQAGLQNSPAAQQAMLMGQNAGLAQQFSAQQYNALLGQPQGYRQQTPLSNWVFNGRACRDAREFADLMWPEDSAEKTFFILKHAGKDTSK